MVTHDIDLVRALHDVAQRVCHYARLDACMLFYRLGLASEELRLAADDRRNLIAAAPECKVKFCLRLLAELLQRLLRRK